MKAANSFLIMLFMLTMISCSDSGTEIKNPTIDELYKNAMIDVMIADENEISNNLIPVTKENSYLNWKVIDGKDYVLCLIFKPFESSYPIGDTISTFWGETWISLVPELKDYFENKQFSNDSTLNLNILQLLGLPFEVNTSRYFIEAWVDPDSIFRPSPDNEITDTKAELQFPDNTPEVYKIWFNNNILNSYFPNGLNAKKYPWTRLGYTYNWSFDANEQGLSEYVLRKNSKIVIRSKAIPREYLND